MWTTRPKSLESLVRWFQFFSLELSLEVCAFELPLCSPEVFSPEICQRVYYYVWHCQCVLHYPFYVVVFQLMKTSHKTSKEPNSFFGLLLLFLSLCMDGICGMQQDVIVPRYKPDALRMQQMLNVYGIAVSLITSLIWGELLPGLRFLFTNKSCLWVCD